MTSAHNLVHNRVRGIFFLHGAGFSSWVPHIPMVQDRLGLGHADLGWALLAAAVGVLAVMPFAGRLTDHFGSDSIVRHTKWAYYPALAIPLFMNSLTTLSIAMFVMGFSAACLDIAMNANGLNVERAKRKSLMSGLHGFWSLGGFAGAGFAALWFALPLPMTLHLPVSVTLLLIVHCYLQNGLMRDPVHAQNTETYGVKQKSIFLILLPFGICAFIGQFGEGVITDWATVLMNSNLQSGPTLAAIGFALYSAAMAAARLSGDRVVDKIGRPAVLIVSSGLASSGYLLLALAPNIIIAWIGCFIAGIGLAVILPLLISAAAQATGKSGGSVVATIAATGYSALMAGPPFIGFIGEHYGLVTAFLMTSVFLGMIIPVYLLGMRKRFKIISNS
ncbi:MFS transporter [Thalassospira sp.]|uniref:MFS transporter n=1 Tax=Thalassospira sp. TaxID=1912094 RepID=UPI002732A5CE|nr:MFS transporter [Thalassospira sp.]MDP2697850.1 MFS transporter [Thalassospira sp.]